jgi:uncharacterized membrane protein
MSHDTFISHFITFINEVVCIKIKKEMSFTGFSGLLGFLYFIFHEPFFLVFFSFFSFFAFWWWAKYTNVIEDERFLQDKFRAFQKSIRIGASAVFIGMILLESIFSHLCVSTKYGVLIALISVCFSLTNILFAYLTYRNDKG